MTVGFHETLSAHFWKIVSSGAKSRAGFLMQLPGFDPVRS